MTCCVCYVSCVLEWSVGLFDLAQAHDYVVQCENNKWLYGCRT